MLKINAISIKKFVEGTKDLRKIELAELLKGKSEEDKEKTLKVLVNYIDTSSKFKEVQKNSTIQDIQSIFLEMQETDRALEEALQEEQAPKEPKKQRNNSRKKTQVPKQETTQEEPKEVIQEEKKQEPKKSTSSSKKKTETPKEEPKAEPKTRKINKVEYTQEGIQFTSIGDYIEYTFDDGAWSETQKVIEHDEKNHVITTMKREGKNISMITFSYDEKTIKSNTIGTRELGDNYLKNLLIDNGYTTEKAEKYLEEFRALTDKEMKQEEELVRNTKSKKTSKFESLILYNIDICLWKKATKKKTA
jgi:hypothetical protein